MRVAIATRSQHKLEEIQALTADLPDLELVSLNDLDVAPLPEEEGIEAFETFEENALAKARYFARRTGLPVLADDSGLCVDALKGAPGVYSKRFSGRSDLGGTALDQSNNDHLLRSLFGRTAEERTAHYVCVVALVTPSGAEETFRGTVDGLILSEPRGSGGFGYDPLFFVPALNATFAEVPQGTKNRISHRAKAVRAALPNLRKMSS